VVKFRGAGQGPVVHRPYRGDDHVLAPYATALAEADAEFSPRVTVGLLDEVLALVPDGWLVGDEFDSAEAARAAYRDHLITRAARSVAWVPAVSAA
jgi:hypothetical protein